MTEVFVLRATCVVVCACMLIGGAFARDWGALFVALVAAAAFDAWGRA